MIRAEIESPMGILYFIEREGALVAAGWAEHAAESCARLSRSWPDEPIRDGRLACLPRVRAYLSGELTALDEIPVDPQGTPFQRRVWEGLRRIPAGETCSYGDLARAIGAPSATRAVGTANGQNPIPIVIPCHRVIAADGKLGGFSSGLPRKVWLLEHEGRVLERQLRLVS
jgi:methylated-DNA-[protein]-cysteine S-methyltransferase